MWQSWPTGLALWESVQLDDNIRRAYGLGLIWCWICKVCCIEIYIINGERRISVLPAKSAIETEMKVGLLDMEETGSGMTVLWSWDVRISGCPNRSIRKSKASLCSFVSLSRSRMMLWLDGRYSFQNQIITMTSLAPAWLQLGWQLFLIIWENQISYRRNSNLSMADLCSD